jgi:hypothetical protein
MTQIQTWRFGVRGCVTHTVGDPAKAAEALRVAFESRDVREVCAWHPDYTTTHAGRTSPGAEWRFFKGAR